MTTMQDRNLGDRSRPLSAVPMDARVVLWSFGVLFGLIAASLSGYSYGLIDHAIQLPLIFRLIDPGYLTNDFFVNSASGFGPVFSTATCLRSRANTCRWTAQWRYCGCLHILP